MRRSARLDIARLQPLKVAIWPFSQEKQRQRAQVAALRASLAPGAAPAVRPPWSGAVKTASPRPPPARPASAPSCEVRKLCDGVST